MARPLHLALCASGTGTTFGAILRAVRERRLAAVVEVLITDRPGTGAEVIAREAGVPVVAFGRAVRGEELSQAISQALPDSIDLVVLAGFLSIVREPLLSRFQTRMINIHPSLLPAHGGAGMYGARVHEAVLAGGETRTGCTVHYVDEGTDTGSIILQREIRVLPGDDAESLSARLRPVEHEALIDAIARIARDASPQERAAR